MRFFLIAGEPSGDALGAALMVGLQEATPGVTFAGIGGADMAAHGLQSRFPMSELTVMGIAEVLPRYRALKRRIRETAEAVIADPPDALITIDSPDFCLRVARLVKASRPDLKTIHYVAPSVWAWRAGRAERMAKSIDHVLALLPFEPPYMQAAGMGCDFVGHPVVAVPQASRNEAAAFRKAHEIAADAPLLLTLPGSRKSEVARLARVFGETVARIAEAEPGLRVVLPVAPNLRAEVQRLVGNWIVAPILVDPEVDGPAAKRAAFGAADAALAASGTVSLELAAARVPMVIAYDMNWLSRQLIGRMLRVETVTLVNLVSETMAVPEFLGAACKADLIAPEVLRLFEGAPEQQAAMDETMQRLGRGKAPPGSRAAQAVLRVLASG